MKYQLTTLPRGTAKLPVLILITLAPATFPEVVCILK